MPEAPVAVMFESVTAVAVTLSWVAGGNGGAEQTFTVYYRQDGDVKILFDEGIATRSNGQRIVRKVQNLLPETNDFFRVQAVNIYGESVHQTEIPATTLSIYILTIAICESYKLKYNVRLLLLMLIKI